MSTLSVKAAKNARYFTPEQPQLGRFIKFVDNELLLSEPRAPPMLFRPLSIRSLTIPNRIGVSPMCTYSTNNFFPTPFHTVHYGAMVTRGPGLLIVECTCIDPERTVTVNDLGMKTQEQAQAHYDRIVEFAHSQNAIIGVQLGHYLRGLESSNKIGLVKDSSCKLDSLSNEAIKQLVREWGKSAKLAIETARYDFIEIQCSKGHSTYEFLSSMVNKRNDEYGGTFENRVRFLLEVVGEIRANIPESTPLFVRIPGADKVQGPESWTQSDTLKLSYKLVEAGVDVLDITGGGYSKDGAKNPFDNKQDFLRYVKEKHKNKQTGLLVASAGQISTPKQAERLLDSGVQDIVLVGRPFLQVPSLVALWAQEMDVKISEAVQYSWGFYPAIEHLDVSLK